MATCGGVKTNLVVRFPATDADPEEVLWLLTFVHHLDCIVVLATYGQGQQWNKVVNVQGHWYFH